MEQSSLIKEFLDKTNNPLLKQLLATFESIAKESQDVQVAKLTDVLHKELEERRNENAQS